MVTSANKNSQYIPKVGDKMAEHDTKSEISKEVLAPPTEIREDLVATAVKFLQNEKVKQSPIGQKRAFLQRKGLTSEEVELAVSRAGVKDTGYTTGSASQSAGPVQVSGVTHPPLPVRDLEISRWTKAQEIVAVVAMVSGISYAAHRLYKEIIKPWLFDTKTDAQRLAALEKVLEDSNTKLSAIEAALGKQQEKLQVLSHDVNSKTSGSSPTQTMSGLSDLKTELASIKGLLLNRRNFPPTPASTPSLPAWQLASSSGDAGGNSNQKDTSTTAGQPSAAITFSETPTPVSPVSMETSFTDSTVSAAVGDNFQSKAGEEQGKTNEIKSDTDNTDKDQITAQSVDDENRNEEWETDKVKEKVNASGDNSDGANVTKDDANIESD